MKGRSLLGGLYISTTLTLQSSHLRETWQNATLTDISAYHSADLLSLFPPANLIGGWGVIDVRLKQWQLMAGWIHELIQFTNPEHLIEIGGLTALLVVVFIESGLFFGFFLPGDSLLFTAGLLCSSPSHHQLLQVNVVVLILLLLTACTLGSLVGYLFGFRMGEYLDEKKDTLFFKKKHLKVTRSFYDKHEHMAFILGRFLPIIRTFVPILAGIIKLPFGRFMFLNVLGCVCWVSSMVLVGYFSGLIFPGLIHYLEYVVIFLVVITMIPVVRTYFREKRELEMLGATEQE